MQKDIRITVITVAFNAREALETTIRSVAGQDYANLEYIVIDGGSADGSLEVIKRHAADITRWVSEPDRGIYDACSLSPSTRRTAIPPTSNRQSNSSSPESVSGICPLPLRISTRTVCRTRNAPKDCGTM